MADQLITGTTLVEKESRSIGDIPISGVVEWDDSIPGTPSLPAGFLLCNGDTIVDSLSPINGQTLPNLNTQYLSISGIGFSADEPDVDDVAYNGTTGSLILHGSAITPMGQVQLPHGATVTAVIVYANVSTEGFLLRSSLLVNNTTLIEHADGTLNSETTTITTPIIDNTTRQYHIMADQLDAGDIIYGAKITYTPRNKFVMRVR